VGDPHPSSVTSQNFTVSRALDMQFLGFQHLRIFSIFSAQFPLHFKDLEMSYLGL
jgi:hypothetical protein